jgi:hypothetical protein
MRVGIRPIDCFSFCLEKSIDDNGVQLAACASRETGGLSTDNRRSSVNGSAGAVRENDLAPVWDSLWIDSTMSGLETFAGAGVFMTFFGPITSNAG